MWLPINSLLQQNEALAKQVNRASESFGLLENGIYLYPFKIGQGFNRVSNTGVDYNLNTNPNNYLGSINVQDINKPIIACWADSWSRVANNDGVVDNLRVGKKIIGFNADTNWMLNIDTISLNEINLTDTYTSHSLTLTFFYEPTIPVFNNTSWDWDDTKLTDYLYLVVNPITQTQQFLIADSVTPIFIKNEENDTAPLGWTVTFSSLNLKFNNAGKNILNFVQCGEVGAPYAWPKEVKDKDGNIITVLDKTRACLTSSNAWEYSKLGTDALQLDYDIAPFYNSVACFGRSVSETNPTIINQDDDSNVFEFSYQTDLPHFVIAEKTGAIDPNITLLSGQLNTKYVAINQARPVARTIYKDWLNWINSGMNLATQKEFQGGLEFDCTTYKPETSNVNQFSITNDGFLFEATLNYHNGITPFTQQDYTLTNPPPHEINNHNALVYLGMNSISLDYEVGYRFSVGEIPVIGKILKLFMLGLNPTWILGLNVGGKQILDNNIPLNGMMTLEQWNMIKYGIFNSSSTPLVKPTCPMEVFSKEQNNYNVVLNKQLASAFAWKLSDKYYSLDNNILDTFYLGQKTKKDGTPLSDNDSKYQKIAPTTKRFFISNVWNRIAGKPNIRLLFRNNYITNEQQLGTNIAQFWQQSNAKFKNDSSLWLNEWEFTPNPTNFASSVTWPQPVSNLPAPETTSDIFGSRQHLLNDTNNTISADNININTTQNDDGTFNSNFNVDPNWNGLVYNYTPPLNSNFKSIELTCDFITQINYSQTRNPTEAKETTLIKTTDNLFNYKIKLILNEDKTVSYEILEQNDFLFPAKNPNANIGGREVPKYTAVTLVQRPAHGSIRYEPYYMNAFYWTPLAKCNYSIFSDSQNNIIGSWSIPETNQNININIDKTLLKFAMNNISVQENDIGFKKFVPALIGKNKTYDLSYGIPTVVNYETSAGQWGYNHWQKIGEIIKYESLTTTSDITSDYLTFELNVVNAKWFK